MCNFGQEERRMTPSYLGNMDLLKRDKVAYFCSRNYAPKAVLASYDWATAQRDKVIISTFHSPLEKDVLEFLLKNKQPVIYVRTKRIYRRVPERFKEALDENRILFVSLFPDTVERDSVATAYQANRYILSQVSEVVFGSIEKGSNTEKIYKIANIAHSRILA